MDNQARRKKIIDILIRAHGNVTGTALSKACQVSRQIIVGDIALLRAQGQEILSTPRGYRFVETQGDGVRRVIVCRHGHEQMEAELNAIVDNGGIVENVVIEHDVYGSLEGTLDLHSRRDVLQYMQRMEEAKAPLLSSISGGIHTHLVKAETEADFDAIERALEDIGVLYK